MSDSPTDRRAEFEASLEEVRLRSGTAETEQRWMTAALVLMVVGVVLGLVAVVTTGSAGDQRDIIYGTTLAVFGLTLAVVGGALFLRYSLGRFFRFWLLRLLYERQADD
jgi:ABC-type antimicrobial peptide transport system permease subunit